MLVSSLRAGLTAGIVGMTTGESSSAVSRESSSHSIGVWGTGLGSRVKDRSPDISVGRE